MFVMMAAGFVMMVVTNPAAITINQMTATEKNAIYRQRTADDGKARPGVWFSSADRQKEGG